jgi:hypothetical protein
MPFAPVHAAINSRSLAMGLLDSIISGVANNALGRSSGIGGLLGGAGRDDDQLAARVNELHQEVQQGGL